MHQRRATAFGSVAAQYNRVRPGYPDVLIDDLVRLSQAGPILEIGCGTGILTRELAGRDCTVVALDPDKEMLAVAREATSPGAKVRLVESSFEDWDGPEAEFDLVVAAQSWHWVDPKLGFDNAGRVLEPGGWLALIWNRPDGDGFEYRNELDEIYRTFAPEIAIGSSQLFTGSLATEVAQLAVPAPFEGVTKRFYPWSEVLTTDRYVDLLGTHSTHIALDETVRIAVLDQVRSLIDAKGGTIEARYESVLVAAQL